MSDSVLENKLLSDDKKANRIDFLDFLRIFASLSVIVGHLFAENFLSIANSPTAHITVKYLFQALEPFYIGGASGVVIFFLISGYIMAHILQKQTTLEFVIKRLFRIYPLYFFVVISEVLLAKIVFGVDFPKLSNLLISLSLFGDFFSVPPTIGMVEWTLRIEIAFYVIMALIKYFFKFKDISLITAGIFATLVSLFLNPFSSFFPLTYAYYNIYFPYLFIGCLIYLLEKNTFQKKYIISVILFMFFGSLYLTSKYQAGWKDSNFAFYSVVLFLICWKFRAFFKSNLLISIFSGLTYSIYLLHRWIWMYLIQFSNLLGINFIPVSLQALILLFLICYILNKTIEKYGIKLGQLILTRVQKNAN